MVTLSRINKAERGSFAPETYHLATLDSPSLVNEDVREQQWSKNKPGLQSEVSSVLSRIRECWTVGLSEYWPRSHFSAEIAVSR